MGLVQAHIVPGFDVALPPQFFCIDIKLPAFGMSVLFADFLWLLDGGGEDLTSVFGMQVLCYDTARCIWDFGGMMGWWLSWSGAARDQDVSLHGSWKDSK